MRRIWPPSSIVRGSGSPGLWSSVSARRVARRRGHRRRPPKVCRGLNAAVNAGEPFDPATGTPAWGEGPDVGGAGRHRRHRHKWAGLRARSRRSLVEGCARRRRQQPGSCRPTGWRCSPCPAACCRRATTTDGAPFLQLSPPAGRVDVAGVCAVLATNLDGGAAAPSTVRRRRQALAQIIGKATGATPTLPQTVRGSRLGTTPGSSRRSSGR